MQSDESFYSKPISELASVTYLDDVQLSDGLCNGSIPNAAIVTCSDMGLFLPYVCSDKSVNLFIFQNLGHRTSADDFLTFIAEKKICHVVVYGHTNCEFTRFLIQPQPENGNPLSSNSYLRSESDKFSVYYHQQAFFDDPQAETKMNEWSILRELRRLANSVSGEECASNNGLKIHAWCLDGSTNTLRIYDPVQKQFVATSAHPFT